ncbi:MAG TPA: TetR family transcriptional regulator [Pseudonocardiaceae bacterium]
MARPERERQMVRVAEQVFAERGYQAASMDEIAERVGVSKPMLYAYFGSKEGLLLACMRRARNGLREVTLAAIAEGGSPRELLRRGLEAHFRFIDAHKPAWAVLRAETALVGEAAAEVEQVRSQQAELIATSTAALVPDIDPLLVEAYAHMLVGATERVSLWREQHPEITPEAAAALILAVIWNGVSSLAPGPPTP